MSCGGNVLALGPSLPYSCTRSKHFSSGTGSSIPSELGVSLVITPKSFKKAKKKFAFFGTTDFGASRSKFAEICDKLSR